MQQEWRALMTRLGVNKAEGQRVLAALAARYEADGRAYHNLAHIQQVLQAAAEIKALAVDYTAVQLAIWFHDVIYVPGAADNEAQSAHFARTTLPQLALAAAQIQAVAALILATRLASVVDRAAGAVAHPDAPIIQDADLAILGQAPPVYDRYAAAIRQEFAHVPDAGYRNGRAQILTHFLEQPRIYHTEQFFVKRESQARQNIQRELESLRLSPRL